jgi:hypothetical protein
LPAQPASARAQQPTTKARRAQELRSKDTVTSVQEIHLRPRAA